MHLLQMRGMHAPSLGSQVSDLHRRLACPCSILPGGHEANGRSAAPHLEAGIVENRAKTMLLPAQQGTYLVLELVVLAMCTQLSVEKR